MNRQTTRAVSVAAALALLPLANGCIWAPELTGIKDEIARQMPGTSFRRNVTLSLGPVAMVAARVVTGAIPDAREARPYLRDVSRVQVAVYELDGATDIGRIRMPARLESLLGKGWELAVRVREPNESIWVLFRADDDSIREMFVVVAEESELVLVKISGRLERILALALDDARRDGGLIPASGPHF